LDELYEEAGQDTFVDFKNFTTLSAVLEELIDERLLLNKAKNLGITIPETNLDLLLEEISQQSQKPIKDLVEEEGLTFGKWREKIKRIWLIGKVSERLCPVQNVTLAEAKNYYFKHKKDFFIPDEVIARQIVVSKREEAQKLLEKIKEGADFSKLAKGYSIAPEAEKGGELEPIYKGEEPPGFEILFSLSVGQISPIVESPYGFHIFQVISKKKAKRLSFKEALPLVKEILKDEKKEACIKKWLEEEKKKVKIVIYKKNLSSLEEIK